MRSRAEVRTQVLCALACAVAVGAIAVPARAGDDRDRHPGARESVYYVTLTDLTYAQGFSFPVAATHAPGFHMFQVGEHASVEAAAIAQNGLPVPMVNLLRTQLGGAVADLYGHPFPMASHGAGSVPWPMGLPYFDATGMVPGLYPTATGHMLQSHIAFTLSARQGDRFSLLMMMMCTNDGLAGLDAVKLPKGLGETARYNVYAYDGGVEQNTERSPDIVDPCALMAPRDADGLPQVPTNDGNRNSPPTPSQPPPGTATDPSIQTMDPIALYTNPAIVGPAGGGDIPADFAWEARRPVGLVTITKID